MNFLKDVDSKFIVAGLGTLAVFGSFVAAAIVYAILEGIGLNDDLVWALAMLVWVAVVVASILAVISFYRRFSHDSVQQVTVIREVLAPRPSATELPRAEPAALPALDEPAQHRPASAGYRSVLRESNETNQPDGSERPNDAPAPLRSRPSVLDQGRKDGPESKPVRDEPAQPDDVPAPQRSRPSVLNRSKNEGESR